MSLPASRYTRKIEGNDMVYANSFIEVIQQCSKAGIQTDIKKMADHQNVCPQHFKLHTIPEI